MKDATTMSVSNLLHKLDTIQQKRPARINKVLQNPFMTITNAILWRLAQHTRFQFFFLKEAKMFYGESMVVPIPPYFDFWKYGAYISDPEVRLTKFLIRNAHQKNLVFFDIGANVGYFSLLVASINKKSQVYAFEPNNQILKVLQKNKRDNITIVQQALSNVVGTIDFYSAGTVNSGISTVNLNNLRQVNLENRILERTSVQTTTLDHFLKRRMIFPAIIKIDAEGAEEYILQGAKKLLAKGGTIVMEVWFDPFTKTYQRAIELLRRSGFCAYAITDDGLLRRLRYSKINSYLTSLKQRYRTVRIKDIAENLVFVK